MRGLAAIRPMTFPRPKFPPAALEERKLEIPTTTNNTLGLHTSMSLRLQHTSGPPDLYASYTSLRRLHTSTSTRLQRISRAPELHTSMSLRMQRTSRPPCLYASYTSLHPQHASRAPELHTSTSASKHLQRISRTPYTSMSPGPHHGARGTRSLATNHEFWLSKN